MTAAPARVREPDARAAAAAALLRLKPDLDQGILEQHLRWLARTVAAERAVVGALDAEVDEINRAHEYLRRAFDIFARAPHPARPLYTPGRDAWQQYRQAVFYLSGFLLPEDPTALAQASHTLAKREHARPGRRRAEAQIKRALANACAGLFYSLTGKLPPVRYVDGRWGELLRAVFDWQELGAFKTIGREAARELARHCDPYVGQKRLR